MPTLKSQYMEAVQTIPFSAKTKTWAIKSKSENAVLGWVKWYGAWRQYCFFPEDGTLFNTGCLASLVAFLADANKEHREGASKEEQEQEV